MNAHVPTRSAALLNTILNRNGLDLPDGRPLRLYHVTDSEYAAIRQALQKCGFMIECEHEESIRLMVLCIAEWFRREATSTRREWRDSGVVPDGLDPNTRTAIVAKALRWWRVGLERSDQGREPLLSLAVQGGIPIHILREGLTSTLATYFRETMAQAWAAWPLDRGGVDTIAAATQDTLIQSLRNPMIVEQAAEAVHALCDLRATPIPTDLDRLATVPWLDTNVEGWRDRVPLHLPGDGAALDVLFCDILTEPPARVAASARIVRVLRREGERWRTGILLPDGSDLPDGTFGLDGMAEGQFGLTLMGEAARAFTGTLGQMYWRPGRGAIPTALTCELGRNARAEVTGIAPSTPVDVRLTRSDIDPRIETWPGGEAVRSEVIAYREVASGSYIMAGRGSVRSGEAHLMVLVPPDAAVTAEEGVVEPMGEVGRYAVWCIEGIAIIDTGESNYRIACGEEAVERVLTIPEAWVPDLLLEDRGLTPMTVGDRCARSHEEGRLVMQGCKSDCGTGRMTCAWLDGEGFSIDRRRVLVLPRAAKIAAHEGDTDGVVVSWAGFRGWQLRVTGHNQDGAVGKAVVETGMATRVPVTLIDPGRRETKCTIDLTVRDPHLANREGTRATRWQEIALSEMSDWMLRLPRKETVDMRLTGVGMKPILVGMEHDGDVPMHELHGTAEWMLALAGDQDARIEMDVHNARLCSLGRPRHMLTESGQYLIAPPGIDLDRPDLHAVIRPFDDGTREYALETMREGVWATPEAGRRPGIAYLRTTGGALTRPRFLLGQGLASDPLSAAMEISVEWQREEAIVTLLNRAPEDPVLLRRLCGLVSSLKGLSPLSLDVLRLLEGRTDTLAAMLISATQEERGPILALERQLRVLWMGIPQTSWQRAVNAQLDAKIVPLMAAKIEGAVAMAAQAMKKELDDLAEAQPWFMAVQGLLDAAHSPKGDLSEIVQTHVRTHGERANRPASLDAILDRVSVPLPPDIAGMDWQTHTALLAPFVLALRLTRNIEISHDERWRLRHALLFDRDYVTDAFPHCVRACKP